LNDLGEPLDWRFQAGNLTQTGLAIPVQTDDYGCLFVLSDIPGLCSDDLAIGERFREDFAALLDRMSLQSMLQQKAANRTRLSLARDLHDSVAQVLAGTLLRLEGLRQSIQAGRKVEEEIDALQQELQIEQRGLRALISQLRGGPLRPDTLLLGESLLSALERASRQWGIACELVRYPENTKIGAQLQHELSQLIREAVANAAKHGRASRVLVFVDLLDSEVLLRVRDNGSGFDLKASRERGAKATPWSLNERIHELGGTLMLSSMSAGSELTMRLPWAPGR
jgi:signal transduction histidine kinase